MFEVRDHCEDAPTRVHARGSLSNRDYGQLIAQLEQSIENRHSDSCWIELRDFHGVEPGSLVDDLHFDVRHCREIRRCAIVGDRAWSSCMPRVARAIFPEAEVRYFETADHHAAEEWLDQSVAALTA